MVIRSGLYTASSGLPELDERRMKYKNVLQGKTHCLNRQSNITMVLSKTMRWDGHVAHTEEKANSYWILKV
jgi:hypothetical protein